MKKITLIIAVGFAVLTACQTVQPDVSGYRKISGHVPFPCVEASCVESYLERGAFALGRQPRIVWQFLEAYGLLKTLNDRPNFTRAFSVHVAKDEQVKASLSSPLGSSESGSKTALMMVGFVADMIEKDELFGLSPKIVERSDGTDKWTSFSTNGIFGNEVYSKLTKHKLGNYLLLVLSGPESAKSTGYLFYEKENNIIIIKSISLSDPYVLSGAILSFAEKYFK